MCGSGTLLIEGALMAADVAPGLRREYFGFLGWRQHDIALWRGLLDEATQRAETGLRGLAWMALDPSSLDDTVWSLGVFNEGGGPGLYVGGDFQIAGDRSSQRLAR